MQDTGVGSGGHNGREGMRGATVADELIGHSRLHLILVAARRNSVQGTLEHLARDIARILHRHQFLRRLHRAQRIQDRRQAAKVVQRIIGFELLGETHLVRRIVGLDARVLRNMQIHMLGVHHQVVEHTLKLLHKHHGLHATQLGCLLLAQPVPEPDDLLRRRVLDKQNLPIGRIGVPWRQGQVSILLVNTTKI